LIFISQTSYFYYLFLILELFFSLILTHKFFVFYVVISVSNFHSADLH